METFRQGLGLVRPFRATMPTTRTDGSAYTHGPEDYFLFYITDDKTLITDPAKVDQLRTTSPGIAAELVNGVFDNTLDIDAAAPGVWFVTYSTVDVVDPSDPASGLEGPVNPTPLELEILAPLAAPLYPAALG